MEAVAAVLLLRGELLLLRIRKSLPKSNQETGPREGEEGCGSGSWKGGRWGGGQRIWASKKVATTKEASFQQPVGQQLA